MRHDRLFLRDILACTESIQSFVAGKSRRELEHDKLLLSAMLHELSVIGEAATRVSRTIQDKYPAVPWRDIGDFRNQVVHAYFSRHCLGDGHKRCAHVAHPDRGNLEKRVFGIGL
jgi:uncharacterized protein with HEPN domain